MMSLIALSGFLKLKGSGTKIYIFNVFSTPKPSQTFKDFVNF